MTRFVKGAERPVNAGRKRGSANKTTPLLRDALLLAGCVAGDRLVELEIIERRARDAAENNSPESTGELKQAVEEHGSLVGYLSWLALEHPNVFGPLLGRVLPLQVKVDSHKDVVYRTLEDVERDIQALAEPLNRIAPRLLKIMIDRDTKPQQVDAKVDNGDGHFDDTEVDRSRGDN